MKIKIFMLMAVLAGAALTGCNGNQKQTAICVGESEMSGISFQVAKNYFFRNDQEIPASSKITTAEEFGKLFGMASTMGERLRSATERRE